MLDWSFACKLCEQSNATDNVATDDHAHSHLRRQGQLNAIKLVGAGGLDVNIQNLEKDRCQSLSTGIL